MSNREVLIKLQDCIKGRLYRFRARNFYFGIYNGDKGFIGIRDKFGSRFLSTEYHWDSEVFGTVWAIEDTGIALPDDVPALERLSDTFPNTALYRWLEAYWETETFKRDCPVCKVPAGSACTDPERSGFHSARMRPL